jgi:mono/diheme cytochrome c family protein
MKKMVFWAMAGLFLGAALLGTPGGAWAQDGKAIFMDKCVPCHGEKGDGKGPLASTFDPKPGKFTDPKFWQGDVNKKIADSVTNGKNQMVPVDLKPDQIKAVTEYINKTFKK